MPTQTPTLLQLLRSSQLSLRLLRKQNKNQFNNSNLPNNSSQHKSNSQLSQLRKLQLYRRHQPEKRVVRIHLQQSQPKPTNQNQRSQHSEERVLTQKQKELVERLVMIANPKQHLVTAATLMPPTSSSRGYPLLHRPRQRQRAPLNLTTNALRNQKQSN
jgi:hypothetical protein